MNVPASWLAERVASLVPNMLPGVTADALGVSGCSFLGCMSASCQCWYSCCTTPYAPTCVVTSFCSA